MDNFVLTYLLLIFGGCLGVFQIAAAAGGFKGLQFFRNILFTYLVGFSILGITFIWFFTNTDLNRPHQEIEGAQQLSFFLLGSLLALVTTSLISSLTNCSGVKSDAKPVIGKGLEDLKSRTVIQAFAHRLKTRGDDK